MTGPRQGSGSSVVERLRTAKDQRQLILATHNANIPVLGDGELIAVLEAEESSGQPVGLWNLHPSWNPINPEVVAWR